MRGVKTLMAMTLLAVPVMAQDSLRAERDASLQMSRYDQAIGKLQQQDEQFQRDIRELQRANGALMKAQDEANAKVQGMADELQRFQNTDVLNIQNGQKQLNARLEEMKANGGPWGDGQRDCKEIGVKHQQIKVAIKPDGSRGVRYLCFDGKVLLLGSEVYSAD